MNIVKGRDSARLRALAWQNAPAVATRKRTVGDRDKDGRRGKVKSEKRKKKEI